MSVYSKALSFGVEEEYQIIDPVTYELAPDAEPIIQEARLHLGNSVQAEIHLSQIEVATKVCYTLEQLRHELQRLRREVIAAAARRQKVVAAAGTHPFSHGNKQLFTPKERYLELEQEYQHLAREQAIFGCHVHVGLGERETALHVMNHARLWLAPLLALTANSPFWYGMDTGYASFRTEQWARWPLAGPPQHFSSLTEYEALIGALLKAGGIEDLTRLYWDMRLSERYPTIEIRIMDVCTTVDDTIMIAGLVRALIHACVLLVLHKKTAPPVRQELLQVAHWRAARYGLNEKLIDIYTMSTVPASHLIEKLLRFVRPSLEVHGDWEEISTLVYATLLRGTGATRQRAIYQHTGSLIEVVRYLVAETVGGTGYTEEERKTA
jgi:glutamate---cysteine ligase / carboxylate-amine ligase